MGISLQQFTLRKDELWILRKQRLNLFSVSWIFWAEAYTLMYWGTGHKISVLTVLLDYSWGFFILTSLSNQPVDYNFFFWLSIIINVEYWCYHYLQLGICWSAINSEYSHQSQHMGWLCLCSPGQRHMTQEHLRMTGTCCTFSQACLLGRARKQIRLFYVALLLQ